MARSIAQIQQSIVDAKNADPVLSAKLTSTSKVAIWYLWTWVIASNMWIMETLFDAHKAEVVQIIGNQKPHRLKWYITKAKQYQHGDTLVADSDVYETVDDDAAVMIIAQAAAVELAGLVRIKVAKNSGGLAALSTPQLTGFTAYMNAIKDAGVRVQCTSAAPDDFRFGVNIYYDPLVLDEDGKRLDGTNDEPVKEAITDFLSTLPFNGLFVLNQLIAALEAVEGILIADYTYAAARYGVLPYDPIDYEYIPDAGYMILDETHFDANVTYTAHGPIN